MVDLLVGKICRWCEVKKPCFEFGVNRAQADGRMSICRECRNKSRRLAPENKAAKAVEQERIKIERQQALKCRIESCSGKYKTAGYCAAHYHRLQRYGDPLGKPGIQLRVHLLYKCSVVECWELVKAKGLCNSHYYRVLRTGDVMGDLPIRTWGSRQHLEKKRYRRVKAPAEHPLANKDGRVAEHRLVLYEHLGAGLHECHWCSTKISWDKRPPSEGSLTVDHLNFVRSDNRVTNLVPACFLCNSLRWEWKEVG